jgi:hypothetical protein
MTLEVVKSFRRDGSIPAVLIRNLGFVLDFLDFLVPLPPHEFWLSAIHSKVVDESREGWKMDDEGRRSLNDDNIADPQKRMLCDDGLLLLTCEGNWIVDIHG